MGKKNIADKRVVDGHKKIEAIMGTDMVLIPEKSINALFASVAAGDRVATNNIINEMRELCEEQRSDIYKTPWHGG